ncbi:DUF2301 domain-containing membrane protein [Myxacorys almedinensis]|uniref:DUF2301 domain-containing membrane protein n=1 Tax=Myxacorys almedinensis A TaxID=2690445 RepID=A0A8J7ZBA2_9CYAN|nr:DUF2301 domain-containing membrane protein [Myxacorys almedinensis]NDJ19783.1 hypothetical protein [Myxacorys almedinensis A]
MLSQTAEPIVYQGQFGEFTVDEGDRKGVIIYRGGLMVAALSVATAALLVFFQPSAIAITALYWLFWAALGVSLFTIHIYFAPLHRALQAFWLIGGLASLGLTLHSSVPLALYVFDHAIAVLGVGFTFAALTGIFFKEAFCFDRLETKLLTPIVPGLLLGHLGGILTTQWEQRLLGAWAVLFLIFAVRKVIQPIPPDIGDKSVFDYLRTHKA